jgi:hypothetical protein
VSDRPHGIRALFDFLFPYLSRSYVGYRTAATAVVAELIAHSAGERDTLYALVNSLLARLGDDAVLCRTQAYTGLGNIAAAGREEVRRPCWRAAHIAATDGGARWRGMPRRRSVR